MKKFILINNERGGFLLAVLIIMLILLLGIGAFFLIKTYEVNMATNKEWNLACRNATETVFRKYTFLAKKGSPKDWRVGPLSELYVFESCQGSGKAADCVNQTWRKKGSGGKGGSESLPYTISVLTDNGTGRWNCFLLPDTLSYKDGFLEGLDVSSNQKCVGLRFENIPMKHFGGSKEASGNSIRTVYSEVIMLEKQTKTTEKNAKVIVEPKVFTSPNPIVYSKTE
ncbi:MAG: hypothetical protein V1872_11850 [bacterium]